MFKLVFPKVIALKQEPKNCISPVWQGKDLSPQFSSYSSKLNKCATLFLRVDPTIQNISQLEKSFQNFLRKQE